MSINLVLSSLLISAFLLSFCHAKSVDVKVTNVLGAGTDLVIHCKDPKHDFGRIVVKFNQSWGFKAEPNLFSTELYHCTLQWDSEFKYFNIYNQNRDYIFCHSACWWHIRKDKACCLDWQTKSYHVCFDYVNGP